MFRQFDLKVTELKRIRIGKLTLGKLKSGDFVEIAKEAVL
jgi:16S rRNA U516 pseudouridylate synthase RsuA-like enzyme